MHMIGEFSKLELDIVGIVAILGEGSTLRNAQASALSWYHVLPRLYPAPQALLKHHQEKRLPTEPGVVVGALSGRIRNELNFFTQLLHDKELDDYSVELVHVSRKPQAGVPDFNVKKIGHLAVLSLLGSCMAATLFALSIWQKDGPALVATIFLSATSSLVGLASWCTLNNVKEIPNAERKDKTPLGDVVIFYPRTGAFRIVRCDDEVSRLYFKVETCEHYFSDNAYRTIALFSTVLLMGGLIMLSNAQPIMQMAFAASYILLNALYWMSSALEPTKHVWEHNFNIEEFGIVRRAGKAPVVQASQQYGALGSATGSAIDVSQAGITTIKSQKYYVNGIWQSSWNPRRAQRVPTKLAILRPGDPKAQPTPEPLWLQFKRHGARFVSFASNNRTLVNSPTSPVTGFSLDQGVQHVHTAATAGHSIPKPASQEKEKPNLTSALWTAIALTGSAKWARSTNIAPNNAAWDQWLDEAGRQATVRCSKPRQIYVPPCTAFESDGKTSIVLPQWPYQTRLSDFFREQSETTRQRYDMQTALDGFDAKLDALRASLRVVISLRIMCTRYRKRKARTKP
ncbi:hypothetical protein PMZ80_006416 [Knufia obscura]|uniref:Uncharacterized protein n=2 Tax=Knufia TaxID=430999 RepID=A0AAN8IMQ3_9EURO|nr:hypothetical protein PMZ80_006416 [Knufia obscura]KAK5953437.1 hypothetical protein OHC33_005381 [Knufia fluminis]